MSNRLAVKVKTLESAPARYVPIEGERRVLTVGSAMRCRIASFPATPLSHVPIGPKTGGFASPPYDGFALTLRGQLIQKARRWQSVPAPARLVTRRQAGGAVVGRNRGPLSEGIAHPSDTLRMRRSCPLETAARCTCGRVRDRGHEILYSGIRGSRRLSPDAHMISGSRGCCHWPPLPWCNRSAFSGQRLG
jgi:hypothetical protein